MEHDLVFVDGPLIEHISGDVFGGDVDAFGAGVIKHVGEKAHFKFKTEQIHAA